MADLLQRCGPGTRDIEALRDYHRPEVITILNSKGAKDGNKCYQSPTRAAVLEERPPHRRYCEHWNCGIKLLVPPFGEPKQMPFSGEPKWAQRRSEWSQWRISSTMFFIPVNSYVKAQY